VVLRLQQATYGTKSTVVGYDGTKLQWQATTVPTAMQATMVHNAMKGYDGREGYERLCQYYGYKGYDGMEGYERL